MSANDVTETRWRAALASLLEVKGHGEACPPAERIWDSVAGGLESGDNEGVILHVGECSACSAAWRLAHRLYSREGEATGTVRVVPLRRMRWIPLAAAAALAIVAIGLGVHRLAVRPDAAPAYREQRETWLVSVLPEGRAFPREEFVLRWAVGPEGTTYDVTVTTEELEPIAQAQRLERPEYRIDPPALEGVPPGAGVLWRVTANLPDGRRVASRTFATPAE